MQMISSDGFNDCKHSWLATFLLHHGYNVSLSIRYKKTSRLIELQMHLFMGKSRSTAP